MHDHRRDHRDMRQRRRRDRATAKMFGALLAIAAFAEARIRGKRNSRGHAVGNAHAFIIGRDIVDWLSSCQPGQNVVMDLLVDSSGVAAWASWRMRCALGRSGISTQKREGDGATPVGVFAMRQLFYRPDREARPRTALPTEALAPADGWCDAPADRAYNRRVLLPYPASAENLWREDHLYDLIVVLGYNDAPVVPGQGSAIFLHLASPDFAPTVGCVALSRDDLLTVLAAADPASRVIVTG
jgi:L,D-peptidoglycan transpeptidase YkuD (ErfK/YbiS/YcfS/YnhG family)